MLAETLTTLAALSPLIAVVGGACWLCKAPIEPDDYRP